MSIRLQCHILRVLHYDNKKCTVRMHAGCVRLSKMKAKGVTTRGMLRPDPVAYHVCSCWIHRQRAEEAILLHRLEQLFGTHLQLNYALFALALSTKFGLRRITLTNECILCIGFSGNELFEDFLFVVVGDRRHRISTVPRAPTVLPPSIPQVDMTSFPPSRETMVVFLPSVALQ